jgi:uncharacterized protein
MFMAAELSSDSEITLSKREFSNEQFNNAELPQLQVLIFEPLSPKYAQVRCYTNLAFSALLLIVALVIERLGFSPLPQSVNAYFILLAFALISITFTAYLYLADQHKKYALREQDLSYASGLVFKKIVSQPILRIQHIELKRGPIERKVGLASLQLFSAGGALHTFEIPGLALKDAQKIRHFILQHKDISAQKNGLLTAKVSNEFNNE